MTTLADHIKALASTDSVKKSKELYLKLNELVGVKFMDVDGYYIRSKNDPNVMQRILWSQQTIQKELDHE